MMIKGMNGDVFTIDHHHHDRPHRHRSLYVAEEANAGTTGNKGLRSFQNKAYSCIGTPFTLRYDRCESNFLVNTHLASCYQHHLLTCSGFM